MSCTHAKPNPQNPRNPMANVLGILTAIVLALSAFIALKNKGKYEQEIQQRQAAQEALDKTKIRLKKAQDNLAGTEKQRAETEEEVARIARDIEEQKKANGEFVGQFETKEKQVAESKAKLDDVRQKLENFGDLETIGTKLRTTRSRILEIEEEIAASESKINNATSETTRLEGVVMAQRELTARFSSKESSPDLKTRIASIYPNWGFVTLAAGNNAGVVADSQLEVVRDGETIAKLQVTAVESGTASASIVPDSVPADAVLMPGDTVVASKKAK